MLMLKLDSKLPNENELKGAAEAPETRTASEMKVGESCILVRELESSSSGRVLVVVS